MKKQFPQVRFIGITAAFLLAIFEVLRLLLLIRHHHLAANIPVITLIQSFIVGLRFDLAVTGYILAPAALIGLLPKIGWIASRLTRRLTIAYLTIMGAVVFLMEIIDLEFFAQFNTRLNHLAIAWMDTPGMVFQMLLEMYSVVPYLFLWIVITFGFWFLLSRSSRRIFQDVKPQSLLRQLIIYPLILALIFLGIRGRVAIKSPLRWGMAYFSQYDFANQLALNSGFTFVRDILDSDKRKISKELSALLPVNEALLKTRELISIDSLNLLPGQSIARYDGEGQVRRLNVIIVIMESQAVEFIKCCGGSEDLAPEFDRIAKEGLLFTRFYSSGFHTFSGLFSTVCGLPILPGKSIMRRVEGQQPFSGLGTLLKERGYNTLFYVTHDPHFDNMKGFLIGNGFDKVIGQSDYPASEVVSSLGVPDEVLFNRVLDDLNRLEQPFLTVIMTGSSHGPFIHPDRPFIHTDPSHPDVKRFNAFRYADWAFGRFYDDIRARDWGDSTLIVALGDHGVNWNPKLELDLSWSHVPLLLTCPGIIEPGVCEHIGGQKDVVATVMDMLGGGWINNTLGRSLLDKDYIGHALVVEGKAYGFVYDNFYFMHSRSHDAALFNLPDLVQVTDNSNLLDCMNYSVKALLSTTNHLIVSRMVGMKK